MKFYAVATTLRPGKAPRTPRLFRPLRRPNLVCPSLVADIAATRLGRSPQTRSLLMRPTRTSRILGPRTASIPRRVLLALRHPTRMRASGAPAHVVNFVFPLLWKQSGPAPTILESHLGFAKRLEARVAKEMRRSGIYFLPPRKLPRTCPWLNFFGPSICDCFFLTNITIFIYITFGHGPILLN